MTAPRMIAKKTRPSWEKALEFASQVGSLVREGPVSEAVKNERLASCRSCKLIDRSPDGLEYCGECDCGRWPVSRLDRKLYFPALECPLGRPGFVNAGQVPDESKIEREPCVGCSMPEPDRSPFAVGSRVIITARMPNEAQDLRPWKVEAARNEDTKGRPTVYDIVRSRRWFTWDWLRSWFRKERATVSRDALARA